MRNRRRKTTSDFVDAQHGREARYRAGALAHFRRMQRLARDGDKEAIAELDRITAAKLATITL